jgi:hypothetical protein
MVDLRNSRWWDRQLEMGLPDCRLSGTNRERTTFQLGRMTFEQVYCANCGAPGGGVTAEWSTHVFYVCDTCARALGPPPGLVEVPEAVVRGRETSSTALLSAG